MRQIIFSITIVFVFAAAAARAQTIAVNPTGVNVNSQNATVVFLTFGRIPAGYVPAEAIWCGELVPAAPPAQGLQCRPDTVYGSLPVRYDLSGASGNAAITDIMAIPPSVVRRAYQAAVAGASAGFFYVRRFTSTTGGPDQFVNVTCRMTGGGARVPFALTDVQIKSSDKEPILFVKRGGKFPDVVAEIQYNGTGRLKGRWEIVQPGEQPPADRDLLTEATLPVEDRGEQRRYTQVERFNHFLPPLGKFSLRLEKPENIPLIADGQYLILLRVEATDDKESDSNLAAVGAGPGVVHSGAVAAFPMPVLKFFLAGNGTAPAGDPEATSAAAPALRTIDPAAPLILSWGAVAGAAAYKLEVLSAEGRPLLTALLLDPVASYSAPPWFLRKNEGRQVRWRLTSIDPDGKPISSEYR